MKGQPMSEAKSGDKVRVHYTGTLDDGSVFDSSKEREPLEFTIGQGQLLKKFEAAVEGMKVGDSKKINCSPEEGYGNKREELIVKLAKNQLPPELNAQEGIQLQMQTQEGHPVPVTVTEITDDTITVDANHRLAGKPINFEIELVEII